jgi:hypothetical protein
MYVWCNIQAHSCKRCCSGKAVLHILSALVASGIQHAMRMCHTVICGLPGSAVIFPHYHIRRDFRNEVLEHRMCFDFLYNFCLEHFTLRRIVRDESWMYKRRHVLFFFYRGHPVVLILTNNIQYFSSDTTRLYIHKNVTTGLLVSVSQNHLSGPQV